MDEGEVTINAKLKGENKNIPDLNENARNVLCFQGLICMGQYAAAGELMTEDACVYLPNTREIFRGRDKYVAFNQKYPGEWAMETEAVYTDPETDTIIAVSLVRSKTEKQSYYLTAFYHFTGTLIDRIIEYWGENGEPPEWRKKAKLSERY